MGTEGTVAPHRYRRAKEFDRNVRVQRGRKIRLDSPLRCALVRPSSLRRRAAPVNVTDVPFGQRMRSRMGARLRRGYAYVKISEKGGRRDVLKELRTGTEGRPVRSGLPHTHGLSPVARVSRGFHTVSRRVFLEWAILA